MMTRPKEMPMATLHAMTARRLGASAEAMQKTTVAKSVRNGSCVRKELKEKERREREREFERV